MGEYLALNLLPYNMGRNNFQHAIWSFSLCLFVGLMALACGSSSEQSDQDDEVSMESSNEEATKEPYGNIDVEGFERMRTQPGIVLLDVRTPGEISDGKVPGALEIDFNADNFEDLVLALDKEREYIVYCAGGGRSSNAAQIMADNGFGNVHNLLGGFNAWSASIAK